MHFINCVFYSLSLRTGGAHLCFSSKVSIGPISAQVLQEISGKTTESELRREINCWGADKSKPKRNRLFYVSKSVTLSFIRFRFAATFVFLNGKLCYLCMTSFSTLPGILLEKGFWVRDAVPDAPDAYLSRFCLCFRVRDPFRFWKRTHAGKMQSLRGGGKRRRKKGERFE